MRSTSHIAPIVVALAIALSPACTRAQFIGVFADPGASSCDLNVQAFIPTTVYIVATLGPQACSGILGAEFRVEGVPLDWYATPMSDPPVPSIMVGDPFREGTQIRYPACLTSESGVVLLLTMWVFPTSFVIDRQLSVVAHSTPSMPEFQCPYVVFCDAPNYTPLCVQGWTSMVNSQYYPWCCQDACWWQPCPPIAVAPRTWAQVKSLYATP